MRRLTNLQWAVIATIHNQPDYKFTGDERKAAERMVKRGFLKRLKDNQYKVTHKGEEIYKQSKFAVDGVILTSKDYEGEV